MGRLQDIDPRFKHLGKKVFFFIMASILGLALTIYVLGREKDIFSAKTRIHLVTNTAAGITRDMPVKLAGVRVGKVSRINLDDAAQVIVDLDIKSKYMKLIREDSTATLFKEDYIGDSVIDISLGTAQKPMLKQNAIIKFERGRGLVEIAQDLAGEMKPLAADVKNFVKYITDPQGDLTRTVKNTARLTAELRESNEKMQALLDESRRAVQNAEAAVGEIRKSNAAVPAVVDAIQKALDNWNTTFADFSKMLKSEVPPVIRDAKDTVGNIKKVTGDISGAASRIRPIVDNVEEITEDGRDITQSLKGNWLLRRNLPPTPPVYLMPEPPAAVPGSVR